jgi:hypothetical protein
MTDKAGFCVYFFAHGGIGRIIQETKNMKETMKKLKSDEDVNYLVCDADKQIAIRKYNISKSYKKKSKNNKFKNNKSQNNKSKNNKSQNNKSQNKKSSKKKSKNKKSSKNKLSKKKSFFNIFF